MNIEMQDNQEDDFTHISERHISEGLHNGQKSDSSTNTTPPKLETIPICQIEPGIKQIERNGFFGTSTRVLTYDVSLVRSFISVIVSPDLTAFATIQQWMNHIGMVLFALFLMIVLANNFFPDGTMGESSACSSDDNSSPSAYNRNMCQLLDVMEDAKDDFQFLVAFILAGYVAGSLASWSTRRSLYSSLCGSTRNLMVMITASLPMDPSKAEVMTARKTLCRWIMLSFELAVLRVSALLFRYM